MRGFSRKAALLVACVAAEAPQTLPACKAVRESVLLQVAAVVPDAQPPPYDEGSEAAQRSPRAPAALGMVEASRTQSSGPSESELQLYRMTKSLREAGYTCPDGTRYAPNSSPFLFDCRLWSAARFWSEEMAQKNFFDHTKGASTPCTRTKEKGYPAMQGCGENIAAGRSTPEEVLQQWKESNGHCKNMMRQSFNHFGAGMAYNAGSKYKHYWTQSFGSDSAADEACLGGVASPQPGPSPNPIAPRSPQSGPAPSPVPTQGQQPRRGRGDGRRRAARQHPKWGRWHRGGSGGSGGAPGASPRPSPSPTPKKHWWQRSGQSHQGGSGFKPPWGKSRRHQGTQDEGSDSGPKWGQHRGQQHGQRHGQQQGQHQGEQQGEHRQWWKR